MATPAQFYDQNGELRLDGSLVGGGGAQPFSAYVLGPFDVAWDDAGIGSNPGALITAIPAGSLLICTRCIVQEVFNPSEFVQLLINVQFGDLHDYWTIFDRWDVGQDAITDGLAGAAFSQDPQSTIGGAFFEAAGNLRCRVPSNLGTQGHADIYALVATL